MSPNKRAKTMSENANGNKGTEIICKKKGIGTLLGLKNLIVRSVSVNGDDGDVTMEACSRTPSATCPICGSKSRSVHSRYVRKWRTFPSAAARLPYTFSPAGSAAHVHTRTEGSTSSASGMRQSKCIGAGQGARKTSSSAPPWRRQQGRRST